MKLRKIVICLFTIFFTAAAMFCAKQERQARIPFSFQAVTEEGTETIRYWQNEDGECYVFLPSYVNLSQLILHSDTPIWLDGRKLSYGMSCEGIELEREYALAGDTGTPGSITFLQSQNLPSIYIDTPSESMDYIHSAKGNKEFAKMRLYSSGGQMEFGGRLESIQARGNSTFLASKKAYSLKLATESDLLGMGKAAKWILLANAYDATNLRNKLVYDFAREAGLPFSPECDWVDLYLNGEYMGLYLLCERNEVHPQRLALQKGQGWLVSKEGQSERSSVMPITDADVLLRVRYSSMEENLMMRIIQSAENAILSPDGFDPETGKHYTDLIDLDSWAKKYLIEEIFGGCDAGLVSQFFYYYGNEPGGKIYAGPVWDYDESVPNVVFPRIFYAHRTQDCPWFHSLYYNDRFFSQIREIYTQTYSDLLASFLTEKIPIYTLQVKQAALLNQTRWGYDDALEEIGKLEHGLNERVKFLNSAWIDNEEFIEVHVDTGYYSNVYDYAIIPGESLPELYADESHSWYYTETDTPIDFTQPIYESTSIYLKASAEFEDLDDAFRETEQKTPPTFSRLTLLPLLLLLIILAAACIKDGLSTRKNIQKIQYFVSSTD